MSSVVFHRKKRNPCRSETTWGWVMVTGFSGFIESAGGNISAIHLSWVTCEICKYKLCPPLNSLIEFENVHFSYFPHECTTIRTLCMTHCCYRPRAFVTTFCLPFLCLCELNARMIFIYFSLARKWSRLQRFVWSISPGSLPWKILWRVMSVGLCGDLNLGEVLNFECFVTFFHHRHLQSISRKLSVNGFM